MIPDKMSTIMVISYGNKGEFLNYISINFHAYRSQENSYRVVIKSLEIRGVTVKSEGISYRVNLAALQLLESHILIACQVICIFS